MATLRICSIPNCDKPHLARGYCEMHYHRWRRNGDPEGGRPSPSKVVSGGCVILGCGRKVLAHGWCSAHYQRWWKFGDPEAGSTSKGEPLAFLNDVVLSFAGNECLPWPYARNDTGYGKIWFEGEVRRVSRIVCEKIHGPAPSEKHEAAHDCGKGHLGCVNPRHLYWATPLENTADKNTHGTMIRGEDTYIAKLTEDDVREIRQMHGKMPQGEIADLFGVARTTISSVVTGRNWKHV